MAQTCTVVLRQLTGVQPAPQDISFTPINGTHRNFRCEWGGQTYLVKSIRNHSGELFSWDSHWRLQLLLAEHGLAPRVLGFQQGVWVEEWHHSPSVSCSDIEVVATIAARIHQLPLISRDASCTKWHPQYSSTLSQTWQNDRVFGHNDLHMMHILGDVIVDWEYSGTTERAYDIAHCFAINRWSVELQNAFLMHYQALQPVFEYDLSTAVNAYLPIVQDINSRWSCNLKQQTI